MFTADDVYAALGTNAHRFAVTVTGTTGSTNTDVKELAAAGAPEGTVVIAGAQTAGRGRQGRSFYSPQDAGLYMSVLLRPKTDALAVTAIAGTAAAEAIESMTGRPAGIKWVNDIYMDGRKVCGILAESSCSAAGMNYTVVGIGINTSPADYPDDIADKAGAAGIAPARRAELAALVLTKLFGYYSALPDKAYMDGYRRRSVLDGRTITYETGGVTHTALVIGIDSDGRLIVRENGTDSALMSGEVHITSRI